MLLSSGTSWFMVFNFLDSNQQRHLSWGGQSSKGGITAGTASCLIWIPTLRDTSLICLHCQKPTFGGGIKYFLGA